MSWEPIDQWPGSGGQTGGPFRVVDEVVIADREGLSWLERVRLYWTSCPEHPYGSSVKRAAMTSRFLYVETLSGEQHRVQHEAFAGERRTKGFHVYGVRDGRDLRLVTRSGCRLQRALQERHQGMVTGSWSERGALYWSHCALVVGLMTLTAWLFREYSPERVLSHLEKIHFTSEVTLSSYAWLGTGLLSVLSFLALPSFLRIDSLGVERVRGVLPLLRFFCPREEVAEVQARKYRLTNSRNGLTTVVTGFDVVLVLHRARRLGGLRRSTSIRVKRFPDGFGRSPSAEPKNSLAKERSHALRHKLAMLLGVSGGDLSSELEEDADRLSEESDRRVSAAELRLWRVLRAAVVLSGALSCTQVAVYTSIALLEVGPKVHWFLALYSWDVRLLLLMAPFVGGGIAWRVCQRLDEGLGAQESRGSLRVNIQTANRAELEALPMIGPWRSSQIESHRDERPFRTVEQLNDVHGIGDGVIRAVQGFITVSEPTHLPSTSSREHLYAYLVRAAACGTVYWFFRWAFPDVGLAVLCLAHLLVLGCFWWVSWKVVLPKTPPPPESGVMGHILRLMLVGCLSTVLIQNVLFAVWLGRSVFEAMGY